MAVVIGAGGGLGAAFVDEIAASGQFEASLGLSRHSMPMLDLLSPSSIADAARYVASLSQPPRLIIDATGFLHGGGHMPEKSWAQIDAAHMAHAFAVNAIGPALLIKHFLPLLPRTGKAAFISLSAKVGSISDNRLGGWYAYRASKAALNQLIRTAAIELARRRPDALCAALHPGTVATGLSAPFGKSGLEVASPSLATRRMLRVIDQLTPAQSGGFFDYGGNVLPW
ncbi:MAG: SDR family oxidoreductase [Sphingomonadales bacterium]